MRNRFVALPELASPGPLMVVTCLLALVFALAAPALAIEPKLSVPIMPVQDIKAGMQGTAYTVYEGSKPEPMQVEVLGVLRNMTGPNSDVILVRLHGKKPEYTGVVAGMSGSPVYIDGKLIGALAFRIGQFSKEPIAGVTPIASMLEINETDASPVAGAPAPPTPATAVVRTSGPGEAPQIASVASYLQPIDTPLVFNGFRQETLQRFAAQFAQAGIMPVMGAGSADPNVKDPVPIQPGSSVGAVLVRGDMDISATCTVTYVDANRLLACGHPLMGSGMIDMPMTKSQVLATLPSPANSFKIAMATETIGAFVQDRHNGILGRFGKEPRMIPVTLNINGAARPHTYHFEVLNQARITPVVMTAAVYNAIQGTNEYGEDTTFRVNGSINIAGFSKVTLNDMYAPSDGGQPTAAAIAAAVGQNFSRIAENPYQRPDITGVELNLTMMGERRFARLETARTDVTEARPGDEIVVETVLRPYRGERLVRQIPIRIPTSAPRGTLRILVSDGETLDRLQRQGLVPGRSWDLAETIAMLNKKHANDHLYVSLLEANPQATVQDKIMPALPLSVMNVMEGMRGTQDMVITAESSVNEASTALDYVVAGQQLITVNVR
ncbi:MAG: SpoIVB peptidase S55 domain-containing protein [Candidatus Korobacteraceae bacterium]|jgi:hypothetical protein